MAHVPAKCPRRSAGCIPECTIGRKDLVAAISSRGFWQDRHVLPRIGVLLSGRLEVWGTPRLQRRTSKQGRRSTTQRASPASQDNRVAPCSTLGWKRKPEEQSCQNKHENVMCRFRPSHVEQFPTTQAVRFIRPYYGTVDQVDSLTLAPLNLGPARPGASLSAPVCPCQTWSPEASAGRR